MGKKQQVADNILDAVIRCKRKADGGYVSLTQISFSAGISERTVNRYFPDKEIMIYQAAARYLRGKYEELAENYAAVDVSDKNALERILLFMRMQVDHYKTEQSDVVMFVRAIITSINTVVYKKVQDITFDEPIRKIFIACIEEGMKEGSIRSDIIPLDAYLLLSSNYNGLMQSFLYRCYAESSAKGQKEHFVAVFEQYLEMLEGYLRPS